MSADYENLRNFILASAKVHLATRTSLTLLSLKVQTIENRLSDSLKTENQQEIELIRRIQSSLDESMANVQKESDALLSILEAYVNG